MKNFYKLAVALLCVNASFGQFNETFDNSASLPAGWAAYTGSNGLGTTQSWGISTTHYHSSNKSAHVHYENVTGGLAEDWLVTPLINLNNYTGCTLRFYGSETYPAMDYGTVYTVKVSTTSQTDRNSFTTIATYGETSFGYSQPMTNQKTIDLSAYNGQQIYVAFVMAQDDGENWTIDDVNITGTLNTASFENENTIQVYPNPVKDLVTVTLKDGIESLQLISITGNIIKKVQNTTVMDMTELASGIYFLKIETRNNATITKKIIKQ